MRGIRDKYFQLTYDVFVFAFALAICLALTKVETFFRFATFNRTIFPTTLLALQFQKKKTVSIDLLLSLDFTYFGSVETFFSRD